MHKTASLTKVEASLPRQVTNATPTACGIYGLPAPHGKGPTVCANSPYYPGCNDLMHTTANWAVVFLAVDPDIPRAYLEGLQLEGTHLEDLGCVCSVCAVMLRQGHSRCSGTGCLRGAAASGASRPCMPQLKNSIVGYAACTSSGPCSINNVLDVVR